MYYTFAAISLVLLFACLPSSSCSGVTRYIEIVNQCSSDYWFDLTSGSAPYINSTLTSCESDADCIAGSYCLLPGTKICFWIVPAPETGVYVVPSQTKNTIYFPYIDNGSGTQWSGNIGFCEVGSSCSQTAAVCNSTGCSVAGGPSNIAEITMAKTGTDFYDISNIGGINVAMSFSPAYINESMFIPGNPYWCGNPGSPTPITAIGPSLWNVSAPSFYYNWVSDFNGTCKSDADCANGKVCGVTNIPGRSPQFELNCGTMTGYWSAGAVCGQDPGNTLASSEPANPFGCGTYVQNGPYNTTLDALYGCGGTSGSGYAANADAYCCGCANWNTVLGPSAVPASTQQCTNSSKTWTQYILPQLEWIKAACPSCYTFPYDDMSSTFVCSWIPDTYNTQNYTITLCPQNKPISSTTTTTTTTTATAITTTTTATTTTATATTTTTTATATTTTTATTNTTTMDSTGTTTVIDPVSYLNTAGSHCVSTVMLVVGLFVSACFLHL